MWWKVIQFEKQCEDGSNSTQSAVERARADDCPREILRDDESRPDPNAAVRAKPGDATETHAGDQEAGVEKQGTRGDQHDGQAQGTHTQQAEVLKLRDAKQTQVPDPRQGTWGECVGTGKATGALDLQDREGEGVQALPQSPGLQVTEGRVD